MPPEFTVFLDENHCRSQHILRPLAEAAIKIESFTAHFPPGTYDPDWLPVVGQRGWVLLTTDKRIRYRHLERLAVERYAMRMFCFTSNFAPALMEAALRRAVPGMRTLVAAQLPPFIATISEAGKLNLLETFGRARPS